MALSGSCTFVGFGFGPIQSGLFLYEAYQSGAFGRLVVAEVVPDVVEAVGSAGRYSLNIAYADRIEVVEVGPIEIENPAVEADRERLIQAVAEAHELATAVPSIDFYTSSGPGSIHRILAQGLRRKGAQGGPRCVIYAAENYNGAARVLQNHVMEVIPQAEREAVSSVVCFVDTVIAKMCGVHVDSPDLAPVTPSMKRAFLVEAFNSIDISRIVFEDADETQPFVRGISVFEEKDDLGPFEEAKLYGHNAVHALAAYLGDYCNVKRIADLPNLPSMMSFLTDALVQESGGALLAKYNSIDPFFTPQGYAAFAHDLLSRMMNPNLRDTVERVGRDPARKLAWNDRLIGAMRLCLSQGIEPKRYALGAAAALNELDGSGHPERVLPTLWMEDDPDPAEAQKILALVVDAAGKLLRWRENGFGNPEYLIAKP